jgi:hypothetical protein
MNLYLMFSIWISKSSKVLAAINCKYPIIILNDWTYFQSKLMLSNTHTTKVMNDINNSFTADIVFQHIFTSHSLKSVKNCGSNDSLSFAQIMQLLFLSLSLSERNLRDTLHRYWSYCHPHPPYCIFYRPEYILKEIYVFLDSLSLSLSFAYSQTHTHKRT